MPPANTTRFSPLTSAQQQSLHGVIEAAVIGHAGLTEMAGDDVDNALSLVAASSAGLKICETLQRESVQNARLAGASWAELGSLLGITRQAAQQRFTPSSAKEWFVTEWIALFESHEIKVRNSWNGGIRLFVDGKQVAASEKLLVLNKEHPELVAWVARDNGASFLVEIFAYALFSVRVKIVVDGKQIGGEIL